MKSIVRFILSGVLLVALLTGSVIVRKNTKEDRSLLTCSEIRVEYADEFRFVSPEDVRKYLDKHYGAYIGQRLDSIRLDRIEAILDAQSAVLKSEAYTTDDKVLHIRLTQREPVIRFQNGVHGYYADENGFIFPLQANYTSHVPIIDGYIPLTVANGYKGAPVSDFEKRWMSGVLTMVRTIDKSRVWKENIVQMHVNTAGDIVMVPREGKELFIFGSPFDADSKLKRMGDYYRYIVPEKGEGYYRTVNVKYDNQIICKQ